MWIFLLKTTLELRVDGRMDRRTYVAVVSIHFRSTNCHRTQKIPGKINQPLAWNCLFIIFLYAFYFICLFYFSRSSFASFFENWNLFIQRHIEKCIEYKRIYRVSIGWRDMCDFILIYFVFLSIHFGLEKSQES